MTALQAALVDASVIFLILIGMVLLLNWITGPMIDKYGHLFLDDDGRW